MTTDLQSQTIAAFGRQWVKYQDNSGFYGSGELFEDIFAPLLRPEEIHGCRVAEIGSGSGRIVRMLLAAGAGHVLAIEPSEAFTVLTQNVCDCQDRVTCLRCTGENIPDTNELDYVFSIGVLHHIPEPNPVVRAARQALRPGGRLAIWLYGREGNGLYLTLLHALRLVTTHLPHSSLAALVWLLYGPLACYILACRILPLPLHGYMTEVIGKMSPEKRRLVIYDQLNPAYAKYYTRAEALELIRRAGFVDVQIHHRHGYSWTVLGTKPAA